MTHHLETGWLRLNDSRNINASSHSIKTQPLHTKVYAHDSDCMLPPDFLESSYVKIHYLHDKK